MYYVFSLTKRLRLRFNKTQSQPRKQTDPKNMTELNLSACNLYSDVKKIFPFYTKHRYFLSSHVDF